ncbi:hypothetical protein [Actinoplanes sp. URMC 104]
MFARKLGRVAGLVFALSVIFGGVGISTGVADGGNAEATNVTTQVWNWD